MSNTAYSKLRSVPVQDTEDVDDYEYDEPDEEYEEYDESDEPTGLFSSPARTVALGFSLLLLFIVAGVVAWELGAKSGQSGQPGTGPSVSTNLSNPNPVSEGPRVGKLAPDFNLIDVHTGKPLQLSSLRGQPVFVNFWGTWCPPCRAEMPEMQKLYDKMHDKVAFVGVSMGPRDEPAGVKQFVDLEKYSWQFVHDGDSNVMLRYQVTGIPSSYFIDKTGIIRAIHVGGADAATLESNLVQALEQQ